MSPVRRGAADVVDRARRLGDTLRERVRICKIGVGRASGTGPADPNAARRLSPSTRSARETTAITIALRGPTFMNVCRLSDTSTETPRMSSSSARTFRLGPTRNSCKGTTRSPRTARHLHLCTAHEQRRQRVARRRRRPEVAADRPAIADLRPADGSRRLRQSRQRLGERPLHRFRIGQAGAEPHRPVLP